MARYRMIFLGRDHPMAVTNHGWGYEHRVVATKKIGRALHAGEVVHHLNGDRYDNRPENLEVLSCAAEHKAKHRKRADLKPFGSENVVVVCVCGCGEELLKYDKRNRPRKCIAGHQARHQWGSGMRS